MQCGEYTASEDPVCIWCKDRAGDAVEDRPSDEEIMDAAAEAVEQQYDVEEMVRNEPARLEETDGLIDFDDVPGPDRVEVGT